MEEVEPVLVAIRYSQCRKCEHLRKFRKTCKVCGCFVLTKVKFDGESCPLGKW